MKLNILILTAVLLGYTVTTYSMEEIKHLFGWDKDKKEYKTHETKRVDTIKFWNAVIKSLERAGYGEEFIRHAQSNLQRAKTRRAHEKGFGESSIARSIESYLGRGKTTAPKEHAAKKEDKTKSKTIKKKKKPKTLKDKKHKTTKKKEETKQPKSRHRKKR